MAPLLRVNETEWRTAQVHSAPFARTDFSPRACVKHSADAWRYRESTALTHITRPLRPLLRRSRLFGPPTAKTELGRTRRTARRRPQRRRLGTSTIRRSDVARRPPNRAWRDAYAATLATPAPQHATTTTPGLDMVLEGAVDVGSACANLTPPVLNRPKSTGRCRLKSSCTPLSQAAS